jgi:pyruvate dehydrogenase E2 component (dihydrolipoamide acetyltransferase)
MNTAIEIRVPDIGEFKDVPVLELLVQPGMFVEADTALITLESEKATIDVPCPVSGQVRVLSVSVGDQVSSGSLIATLEARSSPENRTGVLAPARDDIALPLVPVAQPEAASVVTVSDISAVPSVEQAVSTVQLPVTPIGDRRAYAEPATRALAHQLGIDLSQVRGSGVRGRIVRKDVQDFAKTQLQEAANRAADGRGPAATVPWPKVDFATFGAVERRELSRVQRRSSANLARNWAVIPHVTNFEEADVTDLEAFRIEVNKESGVKVTMLAFLIKASVSALNMFPEFNASLDDETAIFKRYYHVGFAVDTAHGPMVPVIKNADQKGLLAIASEAATLAAQAREARLKLSDIEGGCFSVSSLGGVGGVGFTAIINAPEIAILGAAKARVLPRWDGQATVPRLVLPLSLSWDHRALDGVAAGKFLTFLSKQLSDLRRWIL